ncbi:hypothetical protein PDO_1638 [Rhizobium sp. PDO1-076]|uniref:DUF2946 family protein n=1 Tax=Rhizobium sp. PDO1-076 TaxID=1125979 RepID=UPI00024E3C92|nr:DUF2946 family protein [Rhizobium sp. PDO1-076]EHS52013.1 hypothetical protein PDO_1638 [Rhizobium sp. PDO1-076]
MTKRGPIATWMTMMRMACIIALCAVGFAHRAPVAAASVLSAAEIAALTLPDGSLPDLCLPGQGEDGKSKMHTASTDCEACRISAQILPLMPTDLVGTRLPIATHIALPLRVEAFYRQLFPPNGGPRAPPVSVV